jgi:putative FmdB family regulatory protein
LIAMPLHFYAPDCLPCRLCGDGFEQRVSVIDAPLTCCPTCGQSVRRQAVQSFSAPKLSAGVSVSTAKQAGFTVLKRSSDGHFEKR